MLLKRMEQIHAKNAVRHAEKRRVGTCQFANRIAKLSLQCYQSSVPASHRNANKQTCVAAIVAHFSNSEEGINSVGQLRVLGLGVGTKFLDDGVIKYEQNVDEATIDNCYGKRIRDCHAEVLARRAFRRQLALEILSDLKNESPSTGEGEASNDRDDFSILERSKCTDGNQQHICYRLKSNVTLHFYASSAPCGNATLKKFVKIEKEIFDPSLVCCILVQVLAGVYVLTRVNFF
jgi:double-stranded RNA-specific adenosine deaminase